MSPSLNKDTSGFSLIELLVVVAITSLLALGAIMVLPRGQQVLDEETILIEAASDMGLNAMLSGMDHALSVENGQLREERRSTDGVWNQARTYDISGVGNRVIFHADGRISGGPLRLSRGLVCSGNTQGEFTCRRN